MVIKEERAITKAEVTELVGDSDKAKEIKIFIKGFNKIDADKAREINSKLESLDLIKLKPAYIVKIIDFMPKDAVELNKVLIEVSLDADEVAKILDVIGKY